MRGRRFRRPFGGALHLVGRGSRITGDIQQGRTSCVKARLVRPETVPSRYVPLGPGAGGILGLTARFLAQHLFYPGEAFSVIREPRPTKRRRAIAPTNRHTKTRFSASTPGRATTRNATSLRSKNSSKFRLKPQGFGFISLSQRKPNESRLST